MLVSTGLATALVEVLKKKTPLLTKIADYIEYVAILVGLGVFFVAEHAFHLDLDIWNILMYGAMVGLSSIGLYKTGNATAGVKALLP